MDSLTLKYLQKSFAIVVFVNEVDDHGKKVVDLVPTKWIEKSGSFLVCRYPLRGGKKLQEMIKTQAEPQLSWKQHEVKVLQGADTYEQGERRVERSCAQSTVESTTAGESTDYDDSSDEMNQESEGNFDVEKRDSDDTDSDCSVTIRQKRKRTPKATINLTLDGSANSSKRQKTSRKDSISDVESSGNSRGNTPVRNEIQEETADLSKNFSRKVTSQNSVILSASKKSKDTAKQASIGTFSDSTQNDNGFQQMQQSYFNEALKGLEGRMSSLVKKEIKNAKNSILYDLKKRMEQLSQSLLQNGIETTVGKIEEEKKKLEIQLPIRDFETFKAFDKIVKDDIIKNSAFKSLMQCLLQGSKSVSEGIRNCLPFFMGKEIQLQYTATGRQVKGVGKYNFGETYTYQCMADTLCQLLQVNLKDVLTKTGKWLSGAVDREGGKKDRLRISQ